MWEGRLLSVSEKDHCRYVLQALRGNKTAMRMSLCSSEKWGSCVLMAVPLKKEDRTEKSKFSPHACEAAPLVGIHSHYYGTLWKSWWRKVGIKPQPCNYTHIN